MHTAISIVYEKGSYCGRMEFTYCGQVASTKKMWKEGGGFKGLKPKISLVLPKNSNCWIGTENRIQCVTLKSFIIRPGHQHLIHQSGGPQIDGPKVDIQDNRWRADKRKNGGKVQLLTDDPIIKVTVCRWAQLGN